MKTSPSCGKGLLKRKATTERLKFKGRVLSITGYVVDRCSNCRKEVPTEESKRRAERMLKAFKDKINNNEHLVIKQI